MAAPPSSGALALYIISTGYNAGFLSPSGSCFYRRQVRETGTRPTRQWQEKINMLWNDPEHGSLAHLLRGVVVQQ